MPIYTFRTSKRSKKVYEITCSWKEFDVFLKDNPKFVQEFRMNLGDPWLLAGVMKPDAGWAKHVLGKVKHNTPGANIETGKYHVPREI